MKFRFFDFEVFPNWWCCVFGDLPEDWKENKVTEAIKNNFRVVSSDSPTARDDLMRELLEKDVVKSGYNIKGYDLIIANAIIANITFIVTPAIITLILLNGDLLEKLLSSSLASS